VVGGWSGWVGGGLVVERNVAAAEDFVEFSTLLWSSAPHPNPYLLFTHTNTKSF